ncbi:MAG: hypothetical protein A2516_05335 [Alphaproteobacteria bacterium RIFOXYD12_FULL_60_8]|nr:MAG: hypothetical protein A2516_05335 [Alphaproteobacteria bacterium RIFOXYD12_FULL_60_8]
MKDSGQSHENLTGSHRVQMGSERSFGAVFAVVFLLIGLWPLTDGEAVRVWALGVATGVLAAALLAPHTLRPFNRIWFKFGLLLNKIVSPVVMGLLYYVTVTPLGVMMRLSGKDPLRLKKEPEAVSYWIVREPPGPRPDSMKRQF